MKNFNTENYLRDLEQQAWADVNLSNDPNEMWVKWKNKLIYCISKRVGEKKSPWITSQLIKAKNA